MDGQLQIDKDARCSVTELKSLFKAAGASYQEIFIGLYDAPKKFSTLSAGFRKKWGTEGRYGNHTNNVLTPDVPAKVDLNFALLSQTPADVIDNDFLRKRVLFMNDRQIGSISGSETNNGDVELFVLAAAAMARTHKIQVEYWAIERDYDPEEWSWRFPPAPERLEDIPLEKLKKKNLSVPLSKKETSALLQEIRTLARSRPEERSGPGWS